MTKGTISVAAYCMECNGTKMEWDDLPDQNTMVRCAGCRKDMGPMGSILAMLGGESHTPVNCYAQRQPMT